MKKTTKTTKVTIIVLSMILFWMAASWMDIITHNTNEPVIVYVNHEFKTVQPYADWNLFNLSSESGNN